MKRVFMSAPALVCCAGRNGSELYDSCLSGRRDGFVTREAAAGRFPVGMVSGELPPVKTPQFGNPAFAGGTRIIRLICAALEQLAPAVEKAILQYGREKIGVCLGSCDNGSEASLAAHNKLFSDGAFPEDYDLRYQSASFPAEFVSRLFGICGPVFTAATACASGASAIARGAELIRSGVCGAVIAGGADVVSETVFSGFLSLEAVSSDLTNPFSKNRKGINLGEGAAFFLLTEGDGSGVELLGAGESSDAFHMTAPGTDGAGPVRAMKAALAEAGIESRDIGYVNLHGTGTELNDRAEALAMNAVFPQTPASSTKPVTGHTLGAAGALEAAICWMVLTEKRGLPVHCWDGVKDESLPFTPGLHGEAAPAVCMSNSFAFGGCNVSLIMGRNPR